MFSIIGLACALVHHSYTGRIATRAFFFAAVQKAFEHRSSYDDPNYKISDSMILDRPDMDDEECYNLLKEKDPDYLTYMGLPIANFSAEFAPVSVQWFLEHTVKANGLDQNGSDVGLAQTSPLMTDPKNSSQPERLHQPTKREVDFVIGLQLTTLVLLMVIAFLMCLVFRDFLKEKRLDSDQYQRRRCYVETSDILTAAAIKPDENVPLNSPEPSTLENPEYRGADFDTIVTVTVNDSDGEDSKK